MKADSCNVLHLWSRGASSWEVAEMLEGCESTDQSKCLYVLFGTRRAVLICVKYLLWRKYQLLNSSSEQQRKVEKRIRNRMLKLVGSHTSKARCCAHGTGPLSVPATALVRRWGRPWPAMSRATLAIAALASPRPPSSAEWLQARGNRHPHGGPGADWSFLLFQVTLPEHTPAGSIILTVSATDPDSGSNGDVTFHLAVPSPDIAIDPSNGVWG